MNRQKKGIAIGLFLWGIYAILLMVRTKCIIQGYGEEVNSITQSASQIFNYFILFESGMSAAYLYKMYEPMSQGNSKKLSQLYAGLSISMKRIAAKMLIVLLPVAFGYAYIMNRVNVDYLKAVLIIGLVGIRFIIPYGVSLAKKTLLTAYEYRYMVDILDSLANSTITGLEVLGIVIFKMEITIVLCIGCIINLLFGVLYLNYARKICKRIDFSCKEPSFEAEGMTKDIVIHQVAGLMNINIDTILLSVVDISAVTIYQAYMMLINYPIQLVNRISETFKASIGIRMSDKNYNSYIDFQRLLIFHIFVSIVVISVFLTGVNDFIALWIGKEFCLSRKHVFLLGVYMIPRMLSNAVYIIRDGRGLYRESKKFTLGEALLNLILSVVTVKKYGILGVVLATTISLYGVLMLGNTNLIYREIFQRKNTFYLNFVIVLSAVILANWTYYLIMNECYINTWLSFTFSVCIQTLIALIIACAFIGLFKGKYLRRGDIR